MDESEAPLGTQQPVVQWRLFLRALAEEVDTLAGTGDRDDMLRGVGRRMSRMMPLPAVNSLASLQMEMNDALQMVGWGEVELHLSEPDRVLRIVHNNFPRIGSLGTPAGQWLSALLEGLYDGWFAQQPGNKPSLSTRRMDESEAATVVMSYARR
ncbi:cellulose biosynthesis protein BcsD [Acidisphaera sp. L21]|uniref:cellulose biosynthesis protein BcsD n=1 Tax=Acidisphaera sp. L21 TaxID=1641851 RepID=UPI00131EC317|nr:cellulose biosynthesis protein BcsD [Acidisphaera sp. L21]